MISYRTRCRPRAFESRARRLPGCTADVAVFCAQFARMPVTIGRAVGPQIDEAIEHRTADAANDLRFGMRRQLIVQAAQRAAAAMERNAALHEVSAQSLGGELVGTPQAGKKAARQGQVRVQAESRRQGYAVKITAVNNSRHGQRQDEPPSAADISCCWARISSAKFHVSSRQ